MGCVLTREYVIYVIIVVSFLSTNATPSGDEETPKDGSSLTSADGPRHEKDLSNSHSTEEVQAILPVQVDIGNLVSGFNDHIDEMRENMTNLDEKLEIVKANEASVEKENRRLIEQLKTLKENEARVEEQLRVSKENEATARKSWEEEKLLLMEQLRVSKENEAEARNASKAGGGSSDTLSFETAAAGFTWKGILGGCVNSSDVDDWTLIMHNQNIWREQEFYGKTGDVRKRWAEIYDAGAFQNGWQEYKNGFAFQHSFEEPSEAYWYGLERMHRRTSVGRWQLVLSYVCSITKKPWYYNQVPWTAEKSYNVCISYDNFKVGGEDSFYKLHIGSELSRWGSDGKGWNGNWGTLEYLNGGRFRTNDDEGPSFAVDGWGNCLECKLARRGVDDKCYGGFWFNSDEHKCRNGLHPNSWKLDKVNGTNLCEHVFMAMKKIE